MAVKQLSIFVENQQGKLLEITETLRNNDIDIRALSLADTTDFGILRLIVNRPDRAERTLREQGFTVSQTEVIAIEVNDSPGGLSEALKILTEKGISVEYAYAFVSREAQKAYVILRVDNNELAIKILPEAGISLLLGSQIV